MAWQDRYQKASFRGVEFRVRRTDTQVGRRTAVHEYPQRDEPWAEDMGRAARRFSIDAFVLGTDYDQVRDRLIAALEAKGAGLLIHPFYGRRNVSLASPARISEGPTDEGGMARFSLEFVEAGDNVQPSARADTAGAVATAAGAAKAAVRASFERRFSTASKPDFVRIGAAESIRAGMAALQNARRGLLADASILTDFNAELRNIAGQAETLMQTPASLAARLQDSVAGVRGVAALPSGALAALRQLFGFRLSAAPRTTPSRVQDADNRVAIAGLIGASAVIEASQAVAVMDFESYNQAVALRDELGDELDALADEADETAYAPLLSLRVAMVQDASARGADLARIGNYTPARTLPALVIAHRLFGDATRDAELVARNPVSLRHPGFVPGGVALEYLRDSATE
jgi:prophage DNA circulation protein